MSDSNKSVSPKESKFSNLLKSRLDTPAASLRPTGGKVNRDGLILSLDKLVPNFLQVRQYFDEAALVELAEDIKVRGILEPLIVRESDQQGHYEIIAGERRYRAAQIAGINEVPVIVRQMDDREARFAMLAENVQRQDLDPRDEKRFFEQLQAEFNLSAKGIAELINKSVSYVQKKLYSDANVSVVNSENFHKTVQNTVLREISQTNIETTPIQPKKAKVASYNPVVFKRVSQFFDNTLQVLESKPDKQTVAQIRESVAETEKKLAELKQKLVGLEVAEDEDQSEEA